MVLQFKKIKLYNFGSYRSTEFELSNKGFCLVSGENHCTLDGAISNGAGKSILWSAICYALTGRTIAGLEKNLKNINIEEDLCYVTLNLTVDNNEYEITRYNKPKNDLKIIKNEQDISGKGIRESEKVLTTNLPDLTHDLIASIIILGQGLPNKFSSFSPAGRKELLEKLTKSDTMVETVKTRLAARQGTVNHLLSEYQNSRLVHATTVENLKQTLHNLEVDYDALKLTNFEAEISEKNQLISQISSDITIKETDISKLDVDITETNNSLLELTLQKTKDQTDLQESYNNSTKDLLVQKATLEAELNSLAKEIKHLESITDICPTCGQKLQGISKPDTSKQKETQKQLQESFNTCKSQLSSADAKYKNYVTEINATYDQKIVSLKQHLEQLRSQITQKRSVLNELQNKLTAQQVELSQLKFNQEHQLKRLDVLKQQIEKTQQAISTDTNVIGLIIQAEEDLNEHLQVLKKMDSLVKRDFRGFLLIDIIKYIESRAKEYSQLVFGTTNMSITLNGNDLAIAYNNKAFDNLSGGEKQRCDIILQFALRDLLQTYLGYSSNILVLDEIFDNLDAFATSKIIDLINLKVKDVESLFVVSHHPAELNLPIDSELHIVKNTEGISEILY